MSLFTQVVTVCGGLSTILAAIVIIVRPIREKLMGTKQIADGTRCLLRSDMLHTYYKNHDNNSIRQYEMENFMMEYKAYKALNGNSFIDAIFEEVKTWEVLT